MINNIAWNLVLAHKEALIAVVLTAGIAHLPIVIHAFVTSSFISGWIKKYPTLAKSIVKSLDTEVTAVADSAPPPAP